MNRQIKNEQAGTNQMAILDWQCQWLCVNFSSFFLAAWSILFFLFRFTRNKQHAHITLHLDNLRYGIVPIHILRRVFWCISGGQFFSNIILLYNYLILFPQNRKRKRKRPIVATSLHPNKTYISHKPLTSNKLEMHYFNMLNAKINYFLKAKKLKTASVKGLRV